MSCFYTFHCSSGTQPPLFPPMLPFNPLRNPISLPRFRELEETNSSLNEVLDPLIPYLRDPSSTIPLPDYLGNSVYKNLSWGGEANTSRQDGEGNGKEFSWSRGFGIEYSHIKTRSDRKKCLTSSSQQPVSVSPSTDSGAFRAIKSLARVK